MQDRVPTYPGRVTLTPVAGKANTYDMARADEPTQAGTPLNKATLLKDATAALFGFGVDALPDDMFNALAHTGDLHVWKRTQNGQVDYPVSPNRNAYQEGSDAQPAGYTLGEEVSGFFAVSNINSTGSDAIWQISDSVEISGDGFLNPTVKLVNPKTITFSRNAPGDYQKLIGKYAKSNSSTGLSVGTIYFFPESSQFDLTNTQIRITKYQEVLMTSPIPASTTIEYMGQLGNKVQIKTGSYVGTGTAGAQNPNTLALGFDAFFVLIYANTPSNKSGNQNRGVFFPLLGKFGSADGNSFPAIQYSTVSTNVGVMAWYATNKAYQLNTAKVEYYYFAIG